jgi:hypothetical protein
VANTPAASDQTKSPAGCGAHVVRVMLAERESSASKPSNIQ